MFLFFGISQAIGAKPTYAGAPPSSLQEGLAYYWSCDTPDLLSPVSYVSENELGGYSTWITSDIQERQWKESDAVPDGGLKNSGYYKLGNSMGTCSFGIKGISSDSCSIGFALRNLAQDAWGHVISTDKMTLKLSSKDNLIKFDTPHKMNRWDGFKLPVYLDDGQWHRFLVVSNKNEMGEFENRVYMDGYLVQRSAGDALGQIDGFQIGGWLKAPFGVNGGDIDDIAIWNRPLSEEEIDCLNFSPAGEVFTSQNESGMYSLYQNYIYGGGIFLLLGGVLFFFLRKKKS